MLTSLTKTFCKIFRQSHGKDSLLCCFHIIRHAAECHRSSIRIIHDITGADISITGLTDGTDIDEILIPLHQCQLRASLSIEIFQEVRIFTHLIIRAADKYLGIMRMPMKTQGRKLPHKMRFSVIGIENVIPSLGKIQTGMHYRERRRNHTLVLQARQPIYLVLLQLIACPFQRSTGNGIHAAKILTRYLIIVITLNDMAVQAANIIQTLPRVGTVTNNISQANDLGTLHELHILHD